VYVSLSEREEERERERKRENVRECERGRKNVKGKEKTKDRSTVERKASVFFLLYLKIFSSKSVLLSRNQFHQPFTCTFFI